jgi:hypothetical protein
LAVTVAPIGSRSGVAEIIRGDKSSWLDDAGNGFGRETAAKVPAPEGNATTADLDLEREAAAMIMRE